MMMIKKYTGLIGLCLLLGACTETTGTLGIVETKEEIFTSSATFNVYTKTDSLNLKALPYNSKYGYIGAIRDPETKGLIEASFATQFVTQPSFSLPKSSVMKKEGEEFVCDSVELILFINEAYGDLNNPMKVDVYRMQPDQKKLRELQGISFREDSVADLSERIGGRVFTFYDHTYSDDELYSSSHDHAVRIPLDPAIGSRMIKQYYEHPEWFQDNNLFREHVFPGVYCKISNSEGTMINVSVSALDVCFSYMEHEKYTDGYVRFGGTPEVFQCTRVANPVSRKALCEVEDTTYLKNPDGVITAITLPVDEMMFGHERDSISMCALTLQAYIKDDMAFLPPSQLLLVPHCLRYRFFTEKWNEDERYFYITPYSASYNAYVFSNITRLITGLRILRAQGISTDEDWNRVDVIPVSTTSNSDTYTSISYDISPSSVRLVCGTEECPLQMQVVYSYFAK